MAVKLVVKGTLTPMCSMCLERESITRSVIVQPLISSLSTWLCPKCYPAYQVAVDRMKAADSSLVVTEVAA